jgi:hypothetical protein
VFKSAANKSALFLALLVALTAPAARIYAQAPDEPPTVVSGGDPEPTGEPRPLSTGVVLIPYLIYLA